MISKNLCTLMAAFFSFFIREYRYVKLLHYFVTDLCSCVPKRQGVENICRMHALSHPLVLILGVGEL